MKKRARKAEGAAEKAARMTPEEAKAEIEDIKKMVIGKVKKLHKRMADKNGDLYYSVDRLTKEALKAIIEIAAGGMT